MAQSLIRSWTRKIFLPLLKTELLSASSRINIMGDVSKIQAKAATSIATSKITTANGIIDKKTIKTETRRNHLLETFHEGTIIRNILK